MKKIKVGIDVNEILRARWLKFDKSYVQEFGEDSVPKDIPYVYDFFKGYPWEDTEEEIDMLNEDLPDDINPMDYQIDPKTGESPVDYLAFSGITETLTAKEVYNRFMYEDYLFEIFGAASAMYKNMQVDVEKFVKKYSDTVDFVILSKENWLSIPPTLFFLSKIMSRFKEYRFVDTVEEMWDGIDILITTDPEVLNAGTPDKTSSHVYALGIEGDKHVIKLKRPYNEDCQDGRIPDLLQLNDLFENKEFEKIINYNSKTEENE